MIIIPARLQSTRLKNKLLLPLNGVPLIIHTAKNVAQIDETIVACDDGAILEACKAHGVRAMMTSPLHQSGTDRCAEVARTLDLPRDEIVINVQGDEPFLERAVVESLRDSMPKTPFMASCYKPVSAEDSRDPNLVKVVLDSENFALYFSRCAIPFWRDCTESARDSARDSQESADSTQIYNGHIGIYGFFAWSLQEFCALPKSPLESLEKLEQLRALWHKKAIFMAQVATKSIGIDTQADYKNAQKLMGDLQ